eukprot:GHVN01040863.1.p1 GENE.GHVN01040863.1~~GHVN01040863.1.p1  ORF type:complete len:133 (-),score=7.83 GHVN01040863.1:65-463(-)
MVALQDDEERNHQEGNKKHLGKTWVFDLISLDFIGPREIGGEEWSILVIIDHYSRFCVAEPVKSQETEDLKKALVQTWIRHYGVPAAVLSDRGSAFTSENFIPFVTQDGSSVNSDEPRLSSSMRVSINYWNM